MKKTEPKPRDDITTHSSLNDITHELARLNEERHKAGFMPLSYGKFIAVLGDTAPELRTTNCRGDA